jgi:hypothetical protein
MQQIWAVRDRARCPSAKIANAEIEAEQGYLIGSFDRKILGRKGIEEVNIDAGNGRVLRVRLRGGCGREGASGKDTRSVSQSSGRRRR